MKYEAFKSYLKSDLVTRVFTPETWNVIQEVSVAVLTHLPVKLDESKLTCLPEKKKKSYCPQG